MTMKKIFLLGSCILSLQGSAQAMDNGAKEDIKQIKDFIQTIIRPLNTDHENSIALWLKNKINNANGYFFDSPLFFSIRDIVISTESNQGKIDKLMILKKNQKIKQLKQQLSNQKWEYEWLKDAPERKKAEAAQNRKVLIGQIKHHMIMAAATAITMAPIMIAIVKAANYCGIII